MDLCKLFRSTFEQSLWKMMLYKCNIIINMLNCVFLAACNCTSLGSTSLVCDMVTGVCPCKPGVVNRTCDQCQESFYGFQTGIGCRNCSCNWDGSAYRYCDQNGVCPCKNTTTGSKCDRCKPLHFNFTSNGCT